MTSNFGTRPWCGRAASPAKSALTGFAHCRPDGQLGHVDDAPGLRRLLQRWYRANGRHALPWRLTRDPYAVLVSEVMLQQTQVDRVLPYYTTWLERWPGAGALAREPLAEVIRAWSGLGYNRRALSLHRAAEFCAGRYAGFVPLSIPALCELPGVGEYTANAVACFAGEKAVPVVETNVGRVLARLCGGVAMPRDTTPATLRQFAVGLLPRGMAARNHNLALMDFGALVCTAKSPACDACPFRTACRWRRLGHPEGSAPPRQAPPFESTARFARGRIIEALRATSVMTTEALAEGLPPHHAARILTYLEALARDGLVECEDGAWRLPAQGSTSIASPKL
jgi:A/G-specific adenine glycosylase